MGDSSRSGRAAHRRRQVRRRTFTALAVVSLVVVAVVVGSWAWYKNQLVAASGSHTPVEIVIPRGSSTAGIGSQLVENGVVKNSRAFQWRVRSSGSGPFEAGRFSFTTNLSVDSAIAILAKGPKPPKIVKVSIPEGFRVDQIIDRIHRDVPRFTTKELRAALSSRSVSSHFLPEGSTNYEGVLFPATYEVSNKTSAVGLLQQLADALNDRATNMDLDAGAAALNLSPYEILTVASLVQAEAGSAEEAPKIARVIYNRLSTGQPLGIDATSRYLSIITGVRVDFESPSPFNTRRQPGLPPTPINSPGDFALQAALHPADGDWTYYVRDVTNDAQGNPRHVFTNSVEEFERAKKACHDADLGCGAS